MTTSWTRCWRPHHSAGQPPDTTTQVGPRRPASSSTRSRATWRSAAAKGPRCCWAAAPAKVSGLEGLHIQPTIFSGQNKMRVFQEEIFGPALGVTTFKDEARCPGHCQRHPVRAGAGLWTRDSNLAWRMGRGIQAGRVWVNCYRPPGPCGLGGYKKSGIGRETHKMMLDHHQNTKNPLVSHDINPSVSF